MKQDAHEALTVHLDVESDDPNVELVFRKPDLPASVLTAIENAEATPH